MNTICPVSPIASVIFPGYSWGTNKSSTPKYLPLQFSVCERESCPKWGETWMGHLLEVDGDMTRGLFGSRGRRENFLNDGLV